MLNKYYLIFFILIVNVTISAQPDSIKYVKYNENYKFPEGLYINFNDVIENNPVSPEKINTTISKDDFDFYKNILQNKSISYFDKNGLSKTINTKKIWGYSKNGVLYVNYNDKFNRIPVVGKLAHFVSEVTVIMEDMNNSYYYRHSPLTNSYRSKELRQYIIDFRTGNIYPYHYKNVEELIKQDEELYNEFSKLRKRKKRKLKFLYLRKFNERNSLYLHR